MNISTGGPALTDQLIIASIPICEHASRLGGTWSWEWPENNDLLNMLGSHEDRSAISTLADKARKSKGDDKHEPNAEQREAHNLVPL